MRPETCKSELEDITRNVPHVRFMLEALEKAGCPVNKSFFEIEANSKPVTGGFMPDKGIKLFHNNLRTRTDMENMIAHELIHAYDACRNKDMKWLDLKHHACSEVRASNLSQDCHWLNEFTRFPLTGIFNFVNGHQKCVRRRAELSVAMNPSCKSKEQAKEAVDSVFQQCFRDTRPFNDIP
uniref:Mitochondrial inner membrane protease ATP23 n=1 Tax=Mantoniella antarctica TaxID=81844 RepID=A0A7S0SFR7_9CHLO|mmetsp:Transcript_2310/g.5523  ORF Transcript_2310/g.5523 Transcript_2310/m.5523 type:complete len:181 (+) Transcript_2310:303-845(+)|eukprot:CAMPEP_0181374772 /NCGR_PEP_ID=MMETSP1106-20121128/16226_1 /TAXON_ID=81844 /ORGANISM="Mantoniella antarctica, Strain SL-175" /LENGTH=180 /DNA_ID=CAMNT_0023492831 /DNA_START=198 /DNA_END=740 /DNA_ORIENTATION=+